MKNETITYVLHGGRTSIDSPDNDLFFKQFVDLVDKDKVRIMMNFWSRPRDQWDKLLKRDSAKIKKQTEKKVSFYVPQDPRDLFEKLPKYDVLYVAGGEAELIELHLPELSKLEEALKGKIYCGSSMGSFIVSQHYALSFDSQNLKEVHDGLGIISIMILCHWNIENEKAQKVNLLKEKNSTLPILILDEQEFTVFVK